MPQSKPKSDKKASELTLTLDGVEKKIDNVCQKSQILLNSIGELKDEHKKLKNISNELVKLSKEETKSSKNKYSSLRNDIDRNRFVLVLVDGDDTNFLESFVKRGTAGGSRAANELVEKIREEVDSQAKILVRVYANLGLNDNGLAQKYAGRGGLRKEDFYAFVVGFNRHEHCDFTDTGYEAGNAHRKVIEVFELYTQNNHCEHVFFAGAHNASYSALLTKYTNPKEIRKYLKITLLRRKPFEEEREALENHFETLPVLDSLFRRNRL